MHQFLVLESRNVETNTNPSTDFIDFVALANLMGICANCISPDCKFSLEESPDRTTKPELGHGPPLSTFGCVCGIRYGKQMLFPVLWFNREFSGSGNTAH